MEQKLRDAALRHLGRYASSSANLRRILIRRARKIAKDERELEEGRASIETILVRFSEVGLLDDLAYARRRAENQLRKGKGLRAIHADLRGKGVPRAEADAAIEALREAHEDADLDAAMTYAKKRRIGPFRTEEREAHRQKDGMRLARRGFGWDVVRRVLDAPSPS